MKRALKRLAVAVMLTLASVGVVQAGLTSPALAASWVRPVDGTLGQGFTSVHRGVDFMAARWTPIYAVSDGVVQQVVCDSSSGTCDSDGS